MIVLTFTGPAVADAQPLGLAAAIVGRQAGPRVVVVPALAGIPERLEQMVRFARDGRVHAARALAARVAERHRDLARRAAPGSAAEVIAAVDASGAALEGMLEIVADRRDVPPEVNDAVQAAGRALSSSIVAAALRETGINARDVGRCDLASIDREVTPLLEQEVVPVLAAGPAAVLSAAMVSIAIGARELQVWTDCDGVLAAERSVVPAAHSVPQLSFAEALELARTGVTALHAESLALATSRHIPIVIRNARRPDGPGTVIDGQPSVGPASPAALGCRRRVVALRFSSRETRAPVFMRRILDLCGQPGEPQFIAAVSGTSVVVAFDDRGRAERVAAAAGEFAEVTPLDEVALVSAVGESLATNPRICGAVLEAVRHVTVHASARHPSGRSVTVLVDEADAGEAMRRVYERFFAGGPPVAVERPAIGRQS